MSDTLDDPQALNVKPQYAYFINLIYGGAAILSFLSCLM